MPDGTIMSQIKYIQDVIIPLVKIDKQKALTLFKTMPNHEHDSEKDMYQFIRDTVNGVVL
jgi:hypothetical protein